MKSFLISSSEDRITSVALDRLTLIPKNSVLVVVRSGILSRTLPVALNDMPVTINQDMRAFVPESGIHARFVAWQMVAKYREILSSCSKDGTTVASIEGQALARFPLQIAPAAEQTRIVAKLEELLSDLDAGVAELKAAQKKLQRYRQSLLKAAVEGALTASWRETQRTANTPLETGAELLERILRERRARWEEKQLAKFKEQGKTAPKNWQQKYPEPVVPDTTGLPSLPEGWVWASAEQLCEFITKGTTPPKELDDGSEKTVPFLRVTNLTETGELDLSDKVFVSHKVHERFLARSVVYPNDVLMNIVGPPLGQVSLVPSDFNEWNVNQAIAIFRAVSGVLTKFVSVCLLSVVAQAWLKKRAKTTAGQTNLTLEICRALPIPLPSTDEQGEIIGKVETQLIALSNQNKDISRCLKQSIGQRQNILRAAFAGQLVPQDPSDEPASVLLNRICAERATRGATKKSRGRKTEEPAA
jgi:type I restriction enzyme S subunit